MNKQQLIALLLVMLGWAFGEVYSSIRTELNNHQDSIEGLIEYHMEDPSVK